MASDDDEAMMSRASSRLSLIEGDGGECWDLRGQTLTLGKRPGNDIHLPIDGVSRTHARLRREDEGWVVEDRGSRNGVYVRGERVRIHALQDGDEFLLGTALLRYQRNRPAPRELLRELREFFLSDRRRLVGAGALALILLLMIAIPGRRGSLALREGTTDRPAEFTLANELLRAGSYRQASKAFRSLAIHAPPGANDTPQTLQKLSDVFAASNMGAPTYRWEDAERMLHRAAKLEGLPEETQAWIRKQQAWVEAGLADSGPLLKAEEAARRAQELLAADERTLGVTSLEAAVNLFDGVEKKSLFVELARRRGDELRGRLMGLLLDMARQEIELEKPKYDAGIDLVERAAVHATTREDKATAQRLLSEMRTNSEDEARLSKAVRILSSRRYERYPEATDLLGQVDRRSRVYGEARSWIAWTEADGHTRRAQQLFDQGDVRDALKLLDKAAANKLGEAALQNLRERRGRWVLVRDACERGLRLSRAGQTDRARMELESVLALEPNPTNRFHRLAEDQLRFLSQTTRADQQRTLERGLAALKRADYSAAYRAFELVRRDPKRRQGDGAQIARVVRQVNQERGLLEQARRVILEDDSQRFLEVRDTLELLWRWLHPRDPQRDQARKSLQAVAKRLRSLAAAAQSTK